MQLAFRGAALLGVLGAVIGVVTVMSSRRARTAVEDPDDLLRERLVHLVNGGAGQESEWMPVLAAGPQWAAYGPNGKALVRLATEAADYPWLACLGGATSATLDVVTTTTRHARPGPPDAQRLFDGLQARLRSHPGWNLPVLNAQEFLQRIDEDICQRLELHGAAGSLAKECFMPNEVREDEVPADSSFAPPTWWLYYAGLEVALGLDGQSGCRERLLALRLGHVVASDGPSNQCLICGLIAGPASGVTENPDGSLSWRRGGQTVHVPPVTWMPVGWHAPR